MKSIQSKIVLILVFLFSVTLFAQEVKVPKEVKETFNKYFPNAKNVKWEKEGEEEFEVNFMDGPTYMSVVIDDEGEIEETETVMNLTDLSKVIIDFIAKNYPDYKLTEAAKIVDDKNVVTYEAEISKGKVIKDLMFDVNGQLIINKSKESAEEDEDEEEDIEM
jgi:hypothetical protein